MSEQERKTTTLAAGSDFVRKDFKHGLVKYGAVVGPIRMSEQERNGQKEYFASFNLQGGGEIVHVRVMSKKPIDIKTYEQGQGPIFVSGQKFLVSPKDREGKIIGPRVPVIYARSIHAAEHFLKNEKGEYVYDEKGEAQRLEHPRAGKAIVSKEDSIHNELASSSKELLTGIVKDSKYNVFNKLLGQPDKPYGYESKFRLTTLERDKDGQIKRDENGKPEFKIVTVQCITKQPLNLESMLSREGANKLLSLKGAFQMHDAKRPDNTIVRNVVTFDPVVISQYKEREKEKVQEAPAKEAPKQESRVKDARPANIIDGQTAGEIVFVSDNKQTVLQKVGDSMVVHDRSNLDAEPKVGENVKIAYRDGKGTYKIIDRDKEKGNER